MRPTPDGARPAIYLVCRIGMNSVATATSASCRRPVQVRRLLHLPGPQQQEPAMMTTELRLPELALLAGTRGMLGAGIGLLLADKLGDSQRKGVGWTLVT